MASQRRPPASATASVCSSETERGTHTFQISGYSQYIGLGIDRYISSTRFTIGGHDWRIRFYPDGYGNEEECKDHIGVQLEVVGDFSRVRLAYDLQLAQDLTAIKSESIFSSPSSIVLTAEAPTCGTNCFMSKDHLSRSKYLRDDCLVIHCVVTVIKDPQLAETAVVSSSCHVDVEVPAPDLSSDLEQLLSSGKDADITFKVKSEVFRAHKLILDMRCPALKTQLDGQGQMRDRRTDNNSTINIVEDMEPAVFKALLHFIYTDSLKNEHEEMAKDLLAAADRYAMGRMKLYCGRILSERLTVRSVTSTIAQAHKHHCSQLKDACIQFIVSSPSRMAAVLKSDGCKDLRASFPGVVLDILENSERQKYTRRHSQGNKSLRNSQQMAIVKCQERAIQKEKAGVPYQCFTGSRHVFRSFARPGSSRTGKDARNRKPQRKYQREYLSSDDE